MNQVDTPRAVRRQADLLSVKALAELLRAVVAEPSKYLEDAALNAALCSQGALAKHAAPDNSIHAMSLNHQRAIAELTLGSYEALDNLRRAAKEVLSIQRVRAKRGNARNKEGLLGRVRELESDVALLKQDLALLQRAYDMRCLQARNYAAKADATTQALCAKEQKEIDASFSLRRKSMESFNVVGIEEARKHARPNQ